MDDRRLLGFGLLGGSIWLGLGLAAGWCLLASWLGFGRGPESLSASQKAAIRIGYGGGLTKLSRRSCMMRVESL